MTLFFSQKMVPDCKPEWNREARMVFSRLPSLMAADKPCPQLQPSLPPGPAELGGRDGRGFRRHFNEFQNYKQRRATTPLL